MPAEDQSTVAFTVETNDSGKRLDAFLAGNIDGWSRSRLQRVIDGGDVLVNRKAAKASYKLRENDEIEVELMEVPAARFEPENIPLDIVYEDESLAIINKPAGMVVHPGAGIESGTLANALAHHFKFEISDLKLDKADDGQSKIQNLKSKIGIVHRLVLLPFNVNRPIELFQTRPRLLDGFFAGLGNEGFADDGHFRFTRFAGRAPGVAT